MRGAEVRSARSGTRREERMSTEVPMPQLGESIFEGTITKWLKAIGDPVAIDEPLFEISTDKVDAEIPSPVAGVLAEIRFPEGATVEVNTVVAVIGEAGTKVAAPAAAAKSPAQRSAPPQGASKAAPAAAQIPAQEAAPPQVAARWSHSLIAACAPHRQRARPRARSHRRHRLRGPHHEG